MPEPIDVPPDRFVTLDGVRFHYLDWGGDGDALLLLAGLGCNYAQGYLISPPVPGEQVPDAIQRWRQTHH